MGGPDEYGPLRGRYPERVFNAYWIRSVGFSSVSGKIVLTGPRRKERGCSRDDVNLLVYTVDF
jgi:hypothetical protein